MNSKHKLYIITLRTMPMSYNLVFNILDTFAYFELQAFVPNFIVIFKCQCS